MKNIKKYCLIAAVLAIATCVFGQSAQYSTYQITPIPLGSNSIPATTGLADLTAGWTNTVITTNITTTWSSASSAFTTTTNYTTNTSVLYADFAVPYSRNVALQYDAMFAAGTTNGLKIEYVWAPSVTGRGTNFDLTQLRTNAFLPVAGVTNSFTTNITLDAFGFGRILYIYNKGNTIWTNAGINYGAKRQAP